MRACVREFTTERIVSSHGDENAGRGVLNCDAL